MDKKVSTSKEELEKIKQGYIDLFIRKQNETVLHLVDQMYKIHDECIRGAQASNDPNEAFGLLKEASGIIKVLDNLKTYTGKSVGREQ